MDDTSVDINKFGAELDEVGIVAHIYIEVSRVLHELEASYNIFSKIIFPH